MITLTCKQCGEEFNVTNTLKNTAKFCSLKCFGLWRSNNFSGTNAPQYKNRITITCKYCKNEFEVKPYEKYREFCSKQCVGKAQIGKNNPNYKKRAILICKECGKEFKVKPHLKNYQLFCSHKCSEQYNIGENHYSYLYSKSTEYCDKFNYKCKESNRDKFYRKCFLCGKLETKRKLDVHHVDYDKKQGCNDKKWLLVPLCQSCHGKTSGNQKNRDYYQNLILNLIYMREMILDYNNKIDYRSIL